MARVIRCTACGRTLSEPIGPCPECGGTIEVSIGLTGHSLTLQQANIGAVAREAIDGGGEHTRYSAPTGTRSDTRIDQRIRIVVQAPVDAGLRGEDDVFARVLEALTTSGARPIIVPQPEEEKKSRNDRGEDRAVMLGTKRITIQIITVGPGADFWKGVASSGRGEVEADFETAAQWINEAITKKSSLYSLDQKRAMLLALDVRHFGGLATSAITAIFAERHEELEAHGFDEIWLIGPTGDRCIRLGRRLG